MIRMQQMMRWFGPKDTARLDTFRQAGCTGVVTALHDVPVGDIWQVPAIKKRKALIESAGMTWTVVESLPVHEDIKRGGGRRDELIENYRVSLRNLAECGIEVVTYNFMPVLDWVRTDVRYTLPGGAEALRFEPLAFAVFDLFLLQRPGARLDYPDEQIREAENCFAEMSSSARDTLFATAMLGLPGSSEAFRRDELLEALESYSGIDFAVLKSNRFHFLREVVPTAREVGIGLAIHPDDPPFPVLGLPRVVSTERDLAEILTAVDDPANGLCFCTGSLGARADNDVVGMLDAFGDRINFLHLRNTAKAADGSFHEADHLDGDTDMTAVVRGVLQLMQRSGRSIPMRPDHGHRMLGDLERDYYPGYSEIGRLKGLAELRGLEMGLEWQKEN